MYTASSIFLKTLADAGITHAFVNWGSDHPALLEDLERQRIQGDGSTKPEIVTCPNEMVALSAAQGYAQVTGKPAAVIVHVDVGTQAMAGAIHNVDRSRTPVLIYAGASPFSNEKEHKGSRNEWIMWLQDIPDQSAIVRQYMRFTAQINSGATTAQVVQRSLQIATSEPRGPVYLWARREVMEEEMPESHMELSSNFQKWPSIEPTALSPTASTRIGSALLAARAPLIITSFLGRNPHSVSGLVALSTLLAIPISVACPTAVNVPFSHPYNAGVSFLTPGTHTEHLATADVILVIDCDLPWIPGNNRPSDSARVFVLDSGNPLRTNVGLWHFAAELVCCADSELALGQILESIRKIDEQGSAVGEPILGGQSLKARGQLLAAQHQAMTQSLDDAENTYPDVTGPSAGPIAYITVPNVLGVLRRATRAHTPSHGLETLVLNEGISNHPKVWSHMRPEVPGSLLTSGGSSLGWALGAAVGAHIGGEVVGAEHGKGYELVVAIVGDGSFLFGVPSSAYWMARRYNTPFLTVVLNNGGWKIQSPKLSMLGVHPSGFGSQASGNKLSVGFGPDSPDFSQIAVAASAGWAWGKRVGVSADSGKEELESTIAEAIRIVVSEKRCAVVDCVLESI
ncbi:thiamine pyrophosphate enzyme, N-terminal TPP binding domain-containing protein [Collybia nuda]|uniref:Thiamine pyrophosphate enzyme, N-terminal TPP binding domain-containing protein n=1 Tax=Collybia nuda TaxID=64659 RepID=A0A9P6CKY0_9AGAR|nr:thiamine pyrophosphate enzyme, N-terminal TPP binding domain-containing protein [Collybia nuda]